MLHRRAHATLPGLALTIVTVVLGGLASASPAEAGTSCVPPPVAHRGDRASRPENTLPAFRRAIALGVRRLELDVRFTAGDVPVIMHDATVNRTTDGRGEVAGMALSTLRSLDAGGWFSHAYRGTRVPTLHEALSVAKRGNAYVMVELKTLPTPAQMGLFLDRVRGLGMSRQITVTSFLGDALRAVHAAAPDLRTALIDNPRYRSPDSVLQYGRAYLINEASVTARRLGRWRRAGIAVRPWTVDSERGWRRMAFDKAESVITDRPGAYLAWARRRCR